MVNEPRRALHVPRQCPSCGTRLSASMNFCPACGKKQQAAVPRQAPVFQQAPLSRQAPIPRQAAIFQQAAASKAAKDHSTKPYYAFATVAVFAVAFTAFGIAHHDQQAQTPEVPAVEGTVLEQAHVPAVPIPSEPVSTGQPPLASMPPNPPLAAQIDAAHEAVLERHARSQDDLPATRKINISSPTGVTGNLYRARASLNKNSLWPARRDIVAVLAEQPGNGEAQQMRAELVSRERERDSLLASARLCARDGQWGCARHNAAHAVSVDASSLSARKLLLRAIARERPDPAENDEPGASGGHGDQ
jgi:hypothetical protein